MTALMGRYGKDSLIREISLADTKKLDKQTAALARSYLNQYSFEEVRSVSNGAAVFYLWVSIAHIKAHVFCGFGELLTIVVNYCKSALTLSYCF